ncbi:F-box domain-containing protein [Mycena venus]|uniref:F-box domain-containing protein n=1 Tax=Mycena venus TaxID=2733690 RepID=A0A8H7D7F0_9AGAR|nr:F-box domain-containing protein [Mycena venus]
MYSTSHSISFEENHRFTWTTTVPGRPVFLEQAAGIIGSSRTQIKPFLEKSKSKITHLESQIASLIQECGRERAVAIALRSLLAPIRTLPVELLVEIFLLTIRNGPEDPKSLHFRDAFRLAHVCSTWRQVANGTPQLWTGPIEVAASRANWSDDDIDGMEAWLVRSAPLSLPISLIGFQENDDMPRIVDTLLEVSPRWRSCLLSGSFPTSLLTRLAEHALESLEELDVQYTVGLKLDPSSNFSATPRLQRLKLNAIPDIRMPWAQLTELTLANNYIFDRDISLLTLADCPHLRTASLTIFGWELPRAAVLTKAINLVHLRILVLNFTSIAAGSTSHFFPFFDCLSAPALKELRLSFGSKFTWNETRFTAFQLQSPNITLFEVTNSPLTSANLTAALLHAPTLTHLKLTACLNCIDNSFLRALSYDNSVEPHVPRLHDLSLLMISANGWSEKTLMHMITSRCAVDAEMVSRVARWTRIELQNIKGLPFKFSQRFKDAMRELEHNGVIVLAG